MDYDNEVRKIVEKRIKDNWTTTPIAWDNIKYKPDPSKAFIYPVIEGIGSSLASQKCKRKQYTVTIQVSVPYNSGSTNAINYANTLCQLFEGYSEGGFTCTKGYVARSSIGTIWHQRIVILDCKYFTA